MIMHIMRSTPDGYDLSSEEGYLPDELEWRIVEAADLHFGKVYQQFSYDENGLPCLDIIENGRVTAKISFEKEQ